MNWTGTRVVVSGAAGFIGSHLVEALVEAGADVTAFVHYRSSQPEGLLALLGADVRARCRIVAGDLGDAESVRHAVKGQQVVFHLAALIGIPYSYVNPGHVVQTNVNGTLHMLVAAREAGVERFVHTSTSEVYGTAQRDKIDEAHPIVPQSPYAASKAGADALAQSFYLSFGLPVVTVRPFNCYGPRQSARAVIPAIVSQALSGPEIVLGSLAPTRDFTFVRDTADGMVAAGGAPGVEGQVFNLGSGREISIGALAERIVRLTGRPIAVRADHTRMRPQASEVERLCGDATRARERLNWTPRISLDVGLQRVIAFHQAHPSWTRTGRYEV